MGMKPFGSSVGSGISTGCVWELARACPSLKFDPSMAAKTGEASFITLELT